MRSPKDDRQVTGLKLDEGRGILVDVVTATPQIVVGCVNRMSPH
jgi:hypothetical protein